MSDITITFLVLAAVVVVFIWDRLPVAIVALGTAVTLWATGVLDARAGLAGFGDPTVIFIAALFVVAEALDAGGVTAWAGQQLLAGAGENRTRVLVFMMVLVAAGDGAHHRQRVRGRADAGGGGDGDSPALAAVAAAHAAGLRRTRRIAARAHRDARQRDHRRCGRRRRCRSRSASSSSPSPASPSSSAPSPSSCSSASGCCRTGAPRSISRDFSNHADTLAAQYGIKHAPGTLFTRTTGVAEVVIPPRSALVGETAFPG